MTNLYILMKNDEIMPMIHVSLNGIEDTTIFTGNDINKLKNDIAFIDSCEFLITDDSYIDQLEEETRSTFKNIYVLSENQVISGNMHLYKKLEWQEMCEAIIKQLDSKIEKKYTDIPIHLFKSMTKSSCDVFIEITKNGSPHFVKIINHEEIFDQTMIEKYIDKGVRFLKVETKEKFQLLNIISNDLYLSLTTKPTDNIVGKALDTSLMMLKDIGFNSTSTQLIEGVVEAINTKLSNSTNEMLEIKNLLSSKTSRYYKKAHLISMLGGKMLEMTDWANHNHQNLLTFVSLLSDITLEKEEMLYITSLKDFKESNLSEEDKEIIWTHARDAFHKIQAYKDRPLECDLIILEHHGNKNGVGFNDVLTTQLHKLTLIYRICEDFAIELLKYKDMNRDIKILDIFQYLYIKHDKKVLHLVIDDLKKCFIN